MRKQLIPLIITLLSLIGNNCFAQTFGGGSGNSASDPYLISTKAHLDTIATYVNNNSNNFSGKYFKMMNDIDMSVSGTFNPIGNANNRTFRGNFNGDGHIIYNLTLSITNYVGLFGNILNATIENIGIDSTCSFTCPNHGSSRYYGGTLVAYSSNSNFYNCYSSAQITGNGDLWSIGGLIGASNQDTIKNCYSRSKIFHLPANGQFWNSNYGGIIGEVLNTNTFLILNSYSAPDTIPSGEAPGPGGRVGVLIGNNFTPNANRVVNTYYLKKEYYWADWSQMVDFMNSYIGIPKYIGEMRTEQFAVDLNACQTNTWRWANRDLTLNKGLPMLYWQGIGDTIGCTVSGGTPTEPYRIRYATDLIRLSNDVSEGANYSNSYFIVENDISFKTGSIDSSSFFNPIGNIEINTNSGNVGNNYSFQGYFNGNGHVISNLTLSTANNNNTKYLGLFGNILNATIDSIGIDSTCSFSCPSHTSGTYYTGGLAAYSINSNFNSCYSKAVLIATGDRWYVGGLIGRSEKDTIKNCYSRANISRNGGSTFWNSKYGGLIGEVFDPNNFRISNSYSAPIALPVGNTNSGSLVGNIDGNNSLIINSHYISITGTNNNTGTNQTIEDMRTQPFVSLLNASQSPQPWKRDANYINNGLAILGWQVVLGTEDNPFIISCVRDLINLSNNVASGTSFLNKFFSVVKDINFNNGIIDSSAASFGFNPIGSYVTNTNNKPFSGTIKGNGFAIANYKFSNNTIDNVGLFGYTKDATIKNLGISNINISARNNVGGLVAITNNTTIDSCFVYGFISGVRNVGGLVGFDTVASTINRSFTNTTIDAQTNVGGIAGNYKGTINNSYSNSEIYSSTSANNYVGGIIGNASSSSNLTNVYSACKIIRNGTNTNFGKIKGNSSGTNTNCYSRDSVFVNYTNSNTTGYNGTQKTNAELRSSGFVTLLNNAIWQLDYNDSINDGYPIFTYQPQAVKPNSSGLWPTTTASQVVIIKSGVQLKANTANFPKCAYVKIENGGELNNTTNINLFGEYNRELYAGKWNLIGLSTYTRILSCLYNYTDSISFKTFVKRFNYTTNNWSTITTQDINTQFNFGEGILVMPNYSLDDRLLIKSRIVSKGVLFNDTTLSYNFNNTSSVTNKFVSLANNYPASLDTTLLININSSLIQGRLIYVYDADRGEWNNNWQSTNRVTSIKPSEGFFIASASGTFNFKKSQIKNTSGAKNLIKNELIYVQAIADNNIRESFLEFNEEADNAFDFEDGLMLFGNNYNSVEPYFTIPTPEINDSTTQLIKDAFSSLPYTTELDLRSQKSNEVTLNFSNIPSNIHVYLLDSLLNKAQYLNEEPNYELQVNAGDNAKRLYVLFSYYKEDINDFFKPEMPQEIRIWNYNNVMNIEGKDLIRYEIYDVIGNKLLEQEVFNDDFQTQLSLNNGIYIVRAYSKTNSKTGKLSVNN